MRVILFHQHKLEPIFEVLRTEDEGRTIIARPLFGPPEWQANSWISMPKRTLRALGYYPVEVNDAIVPELQT